MRQDVAERARAGLLLAEAPAERQRRVDASSPAGRCRGSGRCGRACPRPRARAPASRRGCGGSCGRACGRRRPSATAFHIAFAERTSLASGFSHRIALPACAAAIAISAWLSPGVETSTTSMSGRAITSRQSVANSSQPSWAARALDVPAVAAAQHLQPRRELRREEAAHLPPGVAVGTAHEGVADESDVHLAHDSSGGPDDSLRSRAPSSAYHGSGGRDEPKQGDSARLPLGAAPASLRRGAERGGYRALVHLRGAPGVGPGAARGVVPAQRVRRRRPDHGVDQLRRRHVGDEPGRAAQLRRRRQLQRRLRHPHADPERALHGVRSP